MEGFLSTEDSNAPGNNALLDIVAALHWVKQNIRVFGGDPDQVTLMGQGHGAALVNILMISPIAKGETALAAGCAMLKLHWFGLLRICCRRDFSLHLHFY